jgi:hypothetical protein
MKPYMDPANRRRMARMKSQEPMEDITAPEETVEAEATEMVEETEEPMGATITVSAADVGNPKPGDRLSLVVKEVGDDGNVILAMEEAEVSGSDPMDMD